MADIKAIKGTDGTTYSIVDRFSKWGGNNLLKNVPRHITPDTYECASFAFSEPLVEGETYTLQVWFTNSGRNAIGGWVGGGSYSIAPMTAINNNSTYAKWTFTATAAQASTNKWMNIYASTTGGTQGSTAISGTLTVSKVKLEKGHKATDWSPCWEDIFTYSDNTITMNI